MPIKVNGDSRNVNSFTASAPIQQAIEISYTATKIAVLYIAVDTYQAVRWQQEPE
jgi:hypothetical protein